MSKPVNVTIELNGEELKKKLNIRDGRDGIDGQNGRDAEPVDTAKLAQETADIVKEEIKPLIPIQTDIEENIKKDLPTLGEPIRDALELLNGEDRLDKKYINGLDDYDEVARLARQERVIKKYYGGGGSGGSGTGGASAFTDLTDVPSSYTGQGTKVVTVKADETGLEFAAAGGIADGDKGDITVSSSGTVWTVDNGLAATKIADGTVSNVEFQYINSLSSNAQNQLDDKLPYTIADDTNRVLFQYRPATLNAINGTGTIVVLLDNQSTTGNKYFSGVIRGHNYVDRSEFVIKFSGLFYNVGYLVATPTVLSVEGSAYFGTVRLAYDPSNRPCILIGTTGYVWHADSRVTLEQLHSDYFTLADYQYIRDNAPVQTITRITSETGYAIKETKPVAAVDTYTNTNLVKVWGDATPWDYRYSIINPKNVHLGSNTTGTVAIKLPAFVSTVYHIVEIKGFDYTSSTGYWRVSVAGLNTGTSWVNQSVNVEGKPPFTSVRLAYIGADACILLGTTTTAWTRMVLSVDVHHKIGASTDPIYTNATDYSITTAITSEASYSIKATYDCAFNAQRFYSGDGTAALPAHGYYGDTDNGDYRIGANNIGRSVGGTLREDWSTTAKTLSDGYNMAFGSSTGTKIGTATTQKLGFWNVAPVVQQVTAAYTSDGEGAAYTGIDNLQAGSVYATVADLNQLRVAYETLRASYDDLLTKLKNTGIVA